MNTEDNSDIESSSDEANHDLTLFGKGSKQKSVQHTQTPNKKSRKSATRNWKKGTDLQPTLKLLEASAVLGEWKEIIKSPIDVFKAMFSEDYYFLRACKVCKPCEHTL